MNAVEVIYDCYAGSVSLGGLLHGYIPLRHPAHTVGPWCDSTWSRKRNQVFPVSRF